VKAKGAWGYEQTKKEERASGKRQDPYRINKKKRVRPGNVRTRVKKKKEENK
jgi:hypothetical protein